MPGAHSRLSPSSSHRWRPCPGAPNAEAGLADDSGYEAAEGTVFHHFAELCVDLGFEPEAFRGQKIYVEYSKESEDGHRVDGEWIIEFDGEMVDAMKPGLLFLEERMGDDVVTVVEKRVNLEPWLGPGEFGTSDVCIVDVAARRITVFDWKYGQGVPVSPHRNDQAILYALGCWNSIASALFGGDCSDIQVDVVIEQPRAPGGGGMWTTTMRRLLKEGEQVKLDAEATKSPDAPRIAGGKQCRYCKRSKIGCDSLDDYVLEMLDFDADDLDGALDEGALVVERAISPEQRGTLLNNWKLIDRWKDSLHSDALRDALHGEATPGMKAVLGRSPARKYRDSEKRRIEVLLRKELGKDGMYERKLVSPAQAEKKLGKARFTTVFGQYVKQGERKPSLVPESDKREPIRTLDSRLDDLDDEPLDDLI